MRDILCIIDHRPLARPGWRASSPPTIRAVPAGREEPTRVTGNHPQHTLEDECVNSCDLRSLQQLPEPWAPHVASRVSPALRFDSWVRS